MQTLVDRYEKKAQFMYYKLSLNIDYYKIILHPEFNYYTKHAPIPVYKKLELFS